MNVRTDPNREIRWDHAGGADERQRTAGREGTAVPTLPETSEKTTKKAGTVRVLAVQCIACTVLLLIALLLRVAGGEGYACLRQDLKTALAENDLPAAIGRLWDGDPAQAVASDIETANETAPAADTVD